jgi:hypothetical protein
MGGVAREGEARFECVAIAFIPCSGLGEVESVALAGRLV